jgi:hypothetical protein
MIFANSTDNAPAACCFQKWFCFSGSTFVMVFLWRLGLMLFAQQPMPTGDSFFFDGAIVHHLLYGGYFNPSIALFLPISGTEVFCAYPPLYQLPLLVWMSCFGTSALSAMTLHLVLFGCYELALWRVLKLLQIPANSINLAGLFLLAINSYTDRPDSLAHVLGMLAVYCCVRAYVCEKGKTTKFTGNVWLWLMALLVVLTFCTSLQIGGAYFAWLWLATIGSWLVWRGKFPIGPLAAMSLVPVTLVALVKYGFPHLWAGFNEHVAGTPALTGLRIPKWNDLLIVFTATPAVWVASATAIFAMKIKRPVFDCKLDEIILASGLLSILAVLGAALVALSAYLALTVAVYVQPLIVACAITFFRRHFSVNPHMMRWLLLATVGMASIRAVGITTLGVAHSLTDMNYFQAIQAVRSELDKTPPAAKVVVSGEFLYEASQHRDIEIFHRDWLMKQESGNEMSSSGTLIAWKPAKLILTQYDYNISGPVLAELKMSPELAGLEVINHAHWPVPESSPLLLKMLQRVSWAPVVVELHWKQPADR